ncbi:MAG TPA: peptidoglycan recognition family protein [Bryobacteraceae bacterium]|nr:peptidoglycan recognition family protein [Bryobacteraceae bacterium]HOQ47639.1 peptidoglycan recognition family protein [Bryobacteraceae bacterium]HPQ14468.1 peptidoglycan recognition family protein [Bryobacteraceae bacterium]HPU71005.1 peptidoglycan recognition family protein [Bryobacteraceae bacterium]
MGSQLRERVPPRVVDVCASCICDPVTRLKFLRLAKPAPPLPPEPPRRPPKRRRPAIALTVLAAALLMAPLGRVAPTEAPPPPPPVGPLEPPQDSPAPRVWLVEQSNGTEIYSNGLRIEGGPGVPGQPRLYRAFDRNAPDGSRWQWRAEPAGIVFHSSESDVASFEPEMNGILKRQGELLLAYARQRRCYHFLIDRFGRVHRVVEESARADHAGHSIWSDDDWVYVNLNHSFLGVCFEAQTQPGVAVSPAQIHSARVLTEMLRSRYNIPARNCITHAQVSVNPRNFRVGYHTDWARDFPFAQLGLPDNYLQPLPSLTFFGFDADASFVKLAGPDLRHAVSLAQAQVRHAAAGRGIPVARYRAELQEAYARAAAAATNPAGS